MVVRLERDQFAMREVVEDILHSFARYSPRPADYIAQDRVSLDKQIFLFKFTRKFCFS